MSYPKHVINQTDYIYDKTCKLERCINCIFWIEILDCFNASYTIFQAPTLNLNNAVVSVKSVFYQQNVSLLFKGKDTIISKSSKYNGKIEFVKYLNYPGA